MPVQKTDRDTTWIMDQNNKTWTLASNAEINVTNQNGIEANAQAGSTIRVLGDITVNSAAYKGVVMNAADSSLLVGRQSRIDTTHGKFGLELQADGTEVTNRGVIAGDSLAIIGSQDSVIRNFGLVEADRGMAFDGSGTEIRNHGKIYGIEYGISASADGAHLENFKGARITADETAVEFKGSGVGEIVNHGLIRSSDVAIEIGDSSSDIINAGKIVGDIKLGMGDNLLDFRTGTVIGDITMGDGTDTLDIRGGTLDGHAIGGSGNDIYRVSGQIDILEMLGQGNYDKVFSTGNFALSGSIELLQLKGGKNIEGVGSYSANELIGNAGDNVLSGLSGEDWLDGRRGNDILTGGADADSFEFIKGHGLDRITDFAIGEDTIHLQFDGINDFDDVVLHLSQHNDDVWLTIGKDKLVIENVVLEELTEQDFVTSLI